VAARQEVTPPRARGWPGAPRARRRGSEAGLGYAMVSPAILVLLAITGFPLIYNLWNSFHYFNLLQPENGHPYVGLSNYRQFFSSGSGLASALEHTLAYTAVSVPIEVTLGLGIALLLNRPAPGRGVARSLLLLPWAVPTVLSATVWKTMLDPQTGGVDYVLGLLHLPGSHTTWLGTSTLLSWVSVLLADTWQVIPFCTVVLLAGLQGIPRDLYEAAELDGAGAWSTFRRITLPMLRPALMVVLVFRTLSALLIFDIIYALTGGGPGTSTTTLSYTDWHTFLVDGDFGMGGAIAIVMVVVALLIAAVYRLAMRPGR
jgi:ABC-type sugar transport system permease subunit